MMIVFNESTSGKFWYVKILRRRSGFLPQRLTSHDVTTVINSRARKDRKTFLLQLYSHQLSTRKLAAWGPQEPGRSLGLELIHKQSDLKKKSLSECRTGTSPALLLSQAARGTQGVHVPGTWSSCPVACLKQGKCGLCASDRFREGGEWESKGVWI